MPSGDEVTGLHAFDELDPISTVSALNIMPEPPGAQPEVEEPYGASEPPPAAGAGYRGHLRPGRSSPPPPPPRGSVRPPASLGRTIPPPGARADGAPLPPPPRGGLGGMSVPPPPQARRPGSSPNNAGFAPPGYDDQTEQAGAEHDEDTKVVANAYEDTDFATTGNHSLPDGQYGQDDYQPVADGETTEADEHVQGAIPAEPAGFAGEDDAELQRQQGLGDNALLELSAARTVATNIDMDWDEEEVNTKLREGVGPDGRGLATPVPGGTPSPLGRPSAVAVGGNPSPFGPPRASVPAPAGYGTGTRPNTVIPPRATFGGAAANTSSSFPPPQDDWESEDDALTRVRPAPSSLAPVGAVPTTWSGFAPAPAPAALPTEVGMRGAQGPAWLGGIRWQWAVGAAAGLLLIVLAVRALMGGEARPATVTLVTNPPDVEVLVDGRPLVGQSSPFMAQDLTADVEHEVVVRKAGFEAETHRFRIGEGEIKPLPTIDLKPINLGTGFTLASTPEGVQVSVDGIVLPQRTPVRLTDLSPGQHVVRLEMPGFQPWETQVAVAPGQVIDLPAARLLPASAAVARAERRAERAREDDANDEVERSRPSRSERRANNSAPARVAQPAAQPGPAPAPAAGGNMGFLRINSRPWAQVFVDGRFIGNTPLLNAPVPAGKRKVKLTNPDLRMSKSFTLQVQAGKPTTKLVELMN
jgi:hypothetical protein